MALTFTMVLLAGMANVYKGSLGAFYTMLTRFGMSAFGAITIFGLVVAATMWLIRGWHQRNLVRHPQELERLLALARSDKH